MSMKVIYIDSSTNYYSTVEEWLKMVSLFNSIAQGSGLPIKKTSHSLNFFNFRDFIEKGSLLLFGLKVSCDIVVLHT